MELATALSAAGIPIENFRQTLLHEAQELADDDVRINKRLGDFGAALIKPGANLVHHCNTGSGRKHSGGRSRVARSDQSALSCSRTPSRCFQLISLLRVSSSTVSVLLSPVLSPLLTTALRSA